MVKDDIQKEIMSNQLTLIVKETGLEPVKTDMLLSKFGVFYEKAKEIAQNSESIVVTDESQVEEMKKARDARRLLQDIRVEAEKVRKALKEQSLREGRAIDGVYNLIAALIVPVEKRLQQQEKFAEVREAERQAKKHSQRIEQLSKFVEDVTLYSLDTMSDEAFIKLLQNSKTAYDAQMAAKAKAEEERLAELEAHRLEQIRIREENERLKKEAQIREEKIAKENAERERLAAIEKKKQDEAMAKERAEQQAKIDAERKAREAIEKKLKLERELAEKKELQEKQAAEEKKRLEEEEKRKALLAPDKEKLLALSSKLSLIGYPAVESNEAKLIMDKAMKAVNDAVLILQSGAAKL